MKQVLVAGLLALCVIAVSQQQASAWTKHQFSIGLNWSRQSGGNSLGWGAWRNGQPAGPEVYHQHGHAVPHHVEPIYHGYAPAPVDTPMTYQPPTFTLPTTTYGSPFQFATQPRYYTPPTQPYYSR